MLYNLISTQEMLGKIFRDFRPADGSWIADGIEWIGEALQAMDISPLHEKKKVFMKITGHRKRLPCDLRGIRGVEYKGYRLPLGKDLTGLSLSADFPRTTQFAPSSESLNSIYAGTTDTITPPQSSEWDGTNIEIVLADVPGAGDYYMIVPGFIVTNFEEGNIWLHYDAFPTDSRGLPMIPSNYLVKEAILWYVISRMLLAGYEHRKISFEEADTMWKDIKIQAMNDAMFPSIDKVAAFGKMWVRMAQNINLPDQFFMNAEDGERLRLFTNDYSY